MEAWRHPAPPWRLEFRYTKSLAVFMRMDAQSSTKELTQYEQISHMRTRVYFESSCGSLADKIPCTLILEIGSLPLRIFLSGPGEGLCVCVCGLARLITEADSSCGKHGSLHCLKHRKAQCFFRMKASTYAKVSKRPNGKRSFIKCSYCRLKKCKVSPNSRCG